MGKRSLAGILAALLVLCMAGCERTLDDVIRTEASFRGTVISTNSQATLIEIDPASNMSGERAYISFEDVLEGSLTEVQVGDKVVVYYGDRVLESSPLQIPTVYAVLPWEE